MVRGNIWCVACLLDIRPSPSMSALGSDDGGGVGATLASPAPWSRLARQRDGRLPRPAVIVRSRER